MWHDIQEAFVKTMMVVLGTVFSVLTDSKILVALTMVWILVQMYRFIQKWYREDKQK